VRPYLLRAVLCASFTALGAGGYAAATKVWWVDDPACRTIAHEIVVQHQREQQRQQDIDAVLKANPDR
jgi:hypothetical protein